MPVPSAPGDTEYQRLRSECQRFKSHVVDPHTELPTLAAVLDDVRRLMEGRGTLEHWLAVRERPVIWLAPHFVGLDAGGIRIATEYSASSMYSPQKDPVLDRLLYLGRTRFMPQQLIARREGVRAVVRVLRSGVPFYYLPDMDLGPRDSVFVSFFGVPAATITGLSRFAQLGRAVVVPAVTRQLADGYVLTFYPAWENFPTDDPVADTRRMNAFIEDRVREMQKVAGGTMREMSIDDWEKANA